jgi:hypothetical protein
MTLTTESATSSAASLQASTRGVRCRPGRAANAGHPRRHRPLPAARRRHLWQREGVARDVPRRPPAQREGVGDLPRTDSRHLHAPPRGRPIQRALGRDRAVHRRGCWRDHPIDPVPLEQASLEIGIRLRDRRRDCHLIDSGRGSLPPRESSRSLAQRSKLHRLPDVPIPVIAATMRLSRPASLVLVVIGAPHETTHQAMPRALPRLYS